MKGHGVVPFRGVSSLDSSPSDSVHTSLWFHSRWGTGLQTLLAEVKEEERTILVLPNHCEDLRSGRERGKVQESWWEMLEDLLWCHEKKQLGSGVEYMLRDSLPLSGVDGFEKGWLVRKITENVKGYLVFVMGEPLDQEMIRLGNGWFLLAPVSSSNVGNSAAQVLGDWCSLLTIQWERKRNFFFLKTCYWLSQVLRDGLWFPCTLWCFQRNITHKGLGPMNLVLLIP